jgi:hypothetical protein
VTVTPVPAAQITMRLCGEGTTLTGSFARFLPAMRWRVALA